MSRFPGITGKTEVTIAYGIDLIFLEVMTRALLISGSRVSPVSSKRWSLTGQESMLAFVGIIVLHDDICLLQDCEDIGLGIAEEIEGTLSGKDSTLTTQKILICAASNRVVIQTFSELHKIPEDALEPPPQGVSNWSIHRFNSFGKNPLRTKKPTVH